MFPGFRLVRCAFDLILTEGLELPPYKGFAFRGTMGHVLRSLACSIPGEECPVCPFRQTCAYGYLFETVPDATVRQSRKYSSYPRPYVMKPPLEEKRVYRRYDRLSFELVLIGRAIEHIPNLIATFDEIGRRGMRGETGRFIIDRVTTYGADRSESVIWNGGQFTGNLNVVTWEDLSQGCPQKSDTVTLTFHTPLLIEEKGRPLSAAPEFAILVESLCRRASLLYDFHDSGDSAGCLEPVNTSGISIQMSGVHWQSLERITNRQQKKLSTGGLLGSVIYRGDLVQFLPLLRLGEFIHAGKSTTFGFGCYTVQFH